MKRLRGLSRSKKPRRRKIAMMQRWSLSHPRKKVNLMRKERMTRRIRVSSQTLAMELISTSTDGPKL